MGNTIPEIRAGHDMSLEDDTKEARGHSHHEKCGSPNRTKRTAQNVSSPIFGVDDDLQYSSTAKHYWKTTADFPNW